MRWHRFLAVVVLVGLTFTVSRTMAQEGRTRETQILNADAARRHLVDGTPVERLEGNVRLKQGGTYLSANRAIRYPSRNEIVFEGTVVIIDEGDTLRADRVVYDSANKIGEAKGLVTWTDGAVTLTADEATYDVDSKRAAFRHNVTMSDSSTVVHSQFGEYLIKEEQAYFLNDVRLDQDELTILADSLHHDRLNGVTHASGSIRIFEFDIDSVGGATILVAGSVERDTRTGVSRLSDQPSMARIEHGISEIDTILVAAERLVVSTTDSTQAFYAAKNVRMWQRDLATHSDSLRYDPVPDVWSDTLINAVADGAPSGKSYLLSLYGNPVAWNGLSQVSGDTITVVLQGGSPRRLSAGPNAFVALEDSSIGRVQQIKGGRLVAQFRSATLHKLVVSSSAEALYFLADSTVAEEPSKIRFRASEISIQFADGNMDRIVASRDVDGSIEEDSKDDQPDQLDGFEWHENRRPDLDNVLTDALRAALQEWNDLKEGEQAIFDAGRKH